MFQYLGRNFFYGYQNIGKKLSEFKDPIDKKEIWNLFRTIWYNAWRDGIVSLSGYLSGQASVILCSLYLSLTETGAYSIGMQIANVIAMLSSTLYGTYQPAIQSNWLKRDMDKVREIMCLIVSVYVISFLLGAILVLTIGFPLLKLIRPEVIIGVPLMLGIFLGQFVLQFRNCYTSYFSCTNRLDYMSSFIFSSLLYLVITFILLDYFKMESWGLVVGQIISQCLFNIWYWPIKAHRELNLGWSNTWTVLCGIFQNGKASFIKK